MVVDHIGLAVSDLAESKAFFARSLAPLGITMMAEDDGWVGFGRGDLAAFWFGEDDSPRGPMHIAFAAESRLQVDRFHAAALAAGAEDNGAPGVRPQYHAHYYGAFVIGPDGHNIEAVCHDPPPGTT
ncbi:MAG: VOC family protein [Pseudomonadota bacterium]